MRIGGRAGGVVSGGIRAAPAQLPAVRVEQAAPPRWPETHSGAHAHPTRPQGSWGQHDAPRGHLALLVGGPGSPESCFPFTSVVFLHHLDQGVPHSTWGLPPRSRPPGSAGRSQGPEKQLNDSGDGVRAFQRTGERGGISSFPCAGVKLECEGASRRPSPPSPIKPAEGARSTERAAVAEVDLVAGETRIM